MNNDKVKNSIEAWKKNLLDIGKRNQLISFKSRKSTLQIIEPNMSGFLQLLECKNVEITKLFPNFEEEEDDNLESELENKDTIEVLGHVLVQKKYYEKEELLGLIKTYKEKYMKKTSKKYVFTNSSTKIQNLSLKLLMKTSKIFEEENAINVLYIAVGMLNWYESQSSKELIKSPLLLVSVKLIQNQIDGPFVLDFSDSEISLNDSLISKLNSDFGMDINFDLEKEFEYSDIVEKYFNFIKSKFMDSRWSISDEIHLGIFSFSKINMVKDLENNEKLILESPIIRALAGITDDFDPEYTLIDSSEELDAIANPESFFQVLYADSSQELAIQQAIKGKSFVLQGPPGTGKSQTITNIMAELIARGKNVLFVAEKKAALDVVYNNLKKTGLEKYAMPLHNAKIDKKSVIKELNDVLNERQIYPSLNEQSLNLVYEEIKNSREKLNKYFKKITEIHHPIGLSLYELYGEFVKYQSAFDLRFSILDLNNLSHKKIEKITETINGLYSILKLINFNYEEFDWAYFKGETNRSKKEELEDKIKKTITNIDHLFEHTNSDTWFRIDSGINNRDLKDYLDIYEHLLLCEQLSNDYSKIADFDNAKNNLSNLVEIQKNIESNINEFCKYYELSVLREVKITKFNMIVRKHTSKLGRLFSRDYKYVVKEMKYHQKENIKRRKYKNLRDDLAIILETAKLQNEKEQAVSKIEFVNDISDMNHNEMYKIFEEMEWFNGYQKILKNKAINFEKSDQDINSGVIFHEKEFIKKHYEKTEKILNLIQLNIDFISNYFEIELNLIPFNSLKKRFIGMMSNFDEGIENANRLLRTKQEFIELGLNDYYLKIIEQKDDHNFKEIFFRRFYMLLIDEIINSTPILIDFTRETYDNIKSNFKTSDNKLIKNVKNKIDSILYKNAPNINGIEGNNSEVMFLRRETEKKRKIKPIRVLFVEMPNLIMKLKPCLMMSPLSVSTFLKSNAYKFDVVIFDEASQIKPESAIGAIYRSKQVIIVGDKEQLPPTTFFDRMALSEEEDEDDANSYESILDVASTALGSVPLLWHYRSKYEELIKISNAKVYNDKLITFPSQNKVSKGEGIDFVYVENGIYNRGKTSGNLISGQNEKEAEKVIELIIQHFEKYGNKRSLGIVTLNEKQQLAIEKKLNKVLKEKPFLSEFMSKEENPFFIKNIETVQGDERDTIIISVGYGIDKDGKMHMNFGPISKEGGYRRLNVATTRAKINVILVSSIKHNDIDLTRATGRGPEFLKAYLDYAENGLDSKIDSIDNNTDYDLPFELDVHREIIKLGYSADIQVGCSGFKIDMAISHPNNKNKYILGIECDGATYHSSKSARDRDWLRQAILESKGWKIYRIWSTDWFKNRNKEIKFLKEEIENTINGSKFEESDIQVDELIEIIKSDRETKEIDFLIYPNYDEIVNKVKKGSKQEGLKEIIKITSPIHEDEYKKVVTKLFNRQKYTTAFHKDVYEYLDILIKNGVVKKEKIENNNFYIFIGKDIDFRKHSENSSKRDFGSIHPKEIMECIKRITNIAEVIKIENLFQKVSNEFGFKKISESMRKILENRLKELSDCNIISCDENIARMH